MKHRTIFVPMLMPKLSDQAATHLIDILEQLLGIAQHHYGNQGNFLESGFRFSRWAELNSFASSVM